MSILRRKVALIAAAAVTVALGLITIGIAAAADPVSIKLTPWMEGNVNVIDVSISNNTSENLKLDIRAILPEGATLAGASPEGTYRVVSNYVNWIATAAPGKTLVAFQYKFQATKGTTTLSVDYVGSTRGTAAAKLELGASGLAMLAPTSAPVAKLEIVPIPANPAVANAITATIPGSISVAAMSTSGLSNVSVGVPVVLKSVVKDAKGAATGWTWTLTKPSASKATLNNSSAELVKFTPDVAGIYKVDLVASNAIGRSPTVSVQIHADTYIGVDKGGCVQCHSSKVEEWQETGHGTKLKREINGSADPKNSKYNEGCIRCHTVGYNIGVANGGFAEIQAKTGWKFPSADSIKSGKGNWEAIPAELKNVSNIQCENCHGPANDHVKKGTPMAASLDVGVCNQCHDGGGSHTRGTEFANSKHSEKEATAWNYPTGPARQDCVRCHSGRGFVSFLANPTEKAAWDNTPQNPTCAVCHDPHSDANPLQLRIVGKPVEANGVTKDFGLSAVCVECHNGRAQAADAATKGATPHYSAAAEMLSNSGGVDYGQTIVDSPHATIVGAAPMKDPKDATGKALLFQGNTPGACVACHMYPQPTDAKDPNRYTVGQHSFNTVSPDGAFQYTRACQQCHGTDVKTFADIKARADYDGNGKADAAQAEVAGLLKALQSAIGNSGIKPVSGHPYFDQSNKANWTASQKNAIFNYLFVRGLDGSDGKAAAIHNFKRSVMLLQLSYKDLSGKDVPNATILK